MRRLLQLRFEDGARAAREIAELSRTLPNELADRIDLLLASSPAPEQALRYLSRFPLHLITPENARPLVAILTYSHFLSEEVIEHPAWIAEPRDLHRAVESDEFRERLDASLLPGLPHPLALAAFRRQQILRIVIRDVLGFGTLAEVVA